jgi:hypothetical protein
MRAGAVLCAVIGHHWRVDDSSTSDETLLRCTRCGYQHLAAPEATDNQVRGGLIDPIDQSIGPQ